MQMDKVKDNGLAQKKDILQKTAKDIENLQSLAR